MNVIKMSKMLLGQENVTFASCQPPLISVVVIALQVNLHLRALRKSDKSSFLNFGSEHFNLSLFQMCL